MTNGRLRKAESRMYEDARGGAGGGECANGDKGRYGAGGGGGGGGGA